MTDENTTPEAPLTDDGQKQVKEKKPGLFSRLFGKRKKNETAPEPTDTENTDNTDDSDDSDDIDDIVNTDETDSSEEGAPLSDTDDADDNLSEQADEDASETDDTFADKDEQPKKSKKQWKLFGSRHTEKSSAGQRKCPPDEKERTNPYLRLYNELVRHAYDMSDDFIDRSALSDDEIAQIYQYVKGDYPQLFWVNGYQYRPDCMALMFRCTGEGTSKTPDKKLVNGVMKELTNARKPFLKGLSGGKNDEARWQTILTVYRRMVLTIDYDTVGLNNGAGRSEKEDDVLRSLRGALIEHKCVCAGYAVAAQYLLQCLRIKIGYVTSEEDADGSSHAFNMLNLGKTLCYMDVTWGDSSDTAAVSELGDVIFYDYFCVPYREFVMCDPKRVAFHTPSRKMYPMLRQYNSTDYEYYRHIGACVTGYNESRIAEIFADTAVRYASTANAEKEMGRFAVSFRCPNPGEAASVSGKMMSGGLTRVIASAKDKCKGNKKAIALLDSICLSVTGPSGSVLYYFPKKAEAGKGKKK